MKGSSSTSVPLLLFPGLGADTTMFDPLRSRGLEVLTPPYPEPEAGEELPAFAARVAQGAEEAVRLRWGQALGGMVLGGSSFGGMVASEIAARQGARMLVLLGSTLTPRSIPRTLGLAERLGRFLPGPLLGAGLWTGRRLLARSRGFRPEMRQLFLNMGKELSPTSLKRTAWMIFRWRGLSAPACPLLHIHGTRDRVIRPPTYPHLAIEGAGHTFTLTHPDQTVAFLRQALPRETD